MKKYLSLSIKAASNIPCVSSFWQHSIHSSLKGLIAPDFSAFNSLSFPLTLFPIPLCALCSIFCRCSLQGNGAFRLGSAPSAHGSVWTERVILATHCQELLIHPLSLTTHQTPPSHFLVCIQTLFSLSALLGFEQFSKQ